MAGAALTFTSCEDFTDVQPKGKNLLSTTDQLETAQLDSVVLNVSRDNNFGSVGGAATPWPWPRPLRWIICSPPAPTPG